MSAISTSLTSTNAYLIQQRAQANAYVTPQTTQSKAAAIGEDSKSPSDVKPVANSVTLSPMGQKMAAQDKAWATLSPSDLKGVFDRSWDRLVKLDNKFLSVGMAAFDSDIAANGTPEQTAFATDVRNYMVSVHSTPPGRVANPYTGYSREALTSILYDESGAYTDSEKYAAGEEQQKQDFAHFSALYANNATSDDHRQMYVGILDFYDKLSPVEKSAYPPDYKQQIGECLRQEETIFGVLSENDKKAAIDEQSGHSKGDRKEVDEQLKEKKTLFDVFSENDKKTTTDENKNLSMVTPFKSDESIPKQLVEFTAKLSVKS